MEGERIFITGGAGFIGSSVVSELIDSNEIVVFDTMDRDSLSGKSYINNKNLSIIKGDVRDKEVLRRAMRGCTCVIHCAGVAGIDTVIKLPTKTMTVNMIGSANVLEVASELQYCRRVICFSTSEVFGGGAMGATETDRSVIGAAGTARWTYAVSKLAEEHLALAYYQEFGLPVCVLRPFNIYGPGQVGEGALKIFVLRALCNEALCIHGNGTQIRAWCYIDDMVEAVKCVLDNENAVGESFNIGNDRSVETIYGLANTVIRILESSSEVKYVPALSADIELRIPCTEKARKILNFQAKIDLEEGIRRTADFYRKVI